MVNKKKNKFVAQLPIFAWIALILISCSSGQGTEVQKLLEKQAQMANASKGVIVEKITLIEESTQNRNLVVKDQVKTNNTSYDSLIGKLESLESMDSKIVLELSQISSLQDSLEQALNLIQSLDESAESRLVAGINEIDARLIKLEVQQQRTERQISITDKKIEIADSKIQILQNEILILEEEKNNMLREPNTREKTRALDSEIVVLKSNLSSERNKIEIGQLEVKQAREKIEYLTKAQAELTSQIGSDYNSKSSITSFIGIEKDNLENELSNLKRRRIQVIGNREPLLSYQIELQSQISKFAVEQNSTQKNEDMNIEQQVAKNIDSEVLTANKQVLFNAAHDQSMPKKTSRFRKVTTTLAVALGIALLLVSTLFILGRKKRKLLQQNDQ